MSRGLRLYPERCGPATGWDLQNSHAPREVDLEVADVPGGFSLRVVLREADYPGTSRDDLRDRGARLAAAIAPALRAALRAEGIEPRRD